MNQRAIAAAVAMTCIWGSALHWAGAEPQRSLVDSVRAGENRQTDIKSETQRTVADLDAIIAEFERNGLGDGADVQVLKSIRGVLGTLTDKEMQRVIGLLQSARSAPDGRSATFSAAEAVQGQKTIVIQLQQLLLEYQRQQELTALSLRFASLAEDQNKNMKSTRALARKARNASLDEQQNVTLLLQQSEQAAIRDQVAAQLKKLAELGKDPDGTTEEKVAKVLAAAESAGLQKTLAQATSDLMQSRLFSAAVKEKAARDQLRTLARVVAPPREPTAILQEAIEVLAGAINEQRNVLAAAQDLAGAEAATKAADLEERQADLVDGTDLVRRDVGEIAIEAAAELKTSQDKMQLARAAMGAVPQKQVAADNATAALAGLEKARTRLMDQLALLKKQDEDKNVLAQAKQLKEQITALRVAQEKLKGDTGKAADLAASQVGPRQGELGKQAKDILLLVATEAPAATTPMRDAARDMDSARVSISTMANREDAAKAQQSAIANLLKAEKALDQQVAELEKAKDELAKLEQAREQVAKALEKEQKIERETAKLAAKQEKKEDATATPQEKPKPEGKDDQAKGEANKPEEQAKDGQKKPDDQAKDDQTKPDEQAAKQELNAADQQKAAELSKQQEDAAKDTASAKQDAQANTDAAGALDDAKKNMDAAKGNLDQKDPKAANADAKNAVADLNKAKGALDDKIAELKDKLGEQQDDAGKMNELGAQLDKAQQELAGAQQQVDNAQNQPKPSDKQEQLDKAANKMDQVAGELGKAAAQDKGALPKAAEKAIEDANKALSKAMAAAAKGDAQQAKEQAGEAQKALGQAQAAVAMAQQGMPKPGEQPGQQQAQKPGQQPGKPDKADEKNAKKGEGERKDDTVNSDGKTGGIAARGSSGFMNLPARERDAILQDRKERYPEEYGAMIEKYSKDLADSDR